MGRFESTFLHALKDCLSSFPVPDEEVAQEQDCPSQVESGQEWEALAQRRVLPHDAAPISVSLTNLER